MRQSAGRGQAWRRAGEVLGAALLLLSVSVAAAAAAPSVAALAGQGDVAALQRLGPEIVPELARLYEQGGEAERWKLAALFSRLNWQSPRLEAVLLRDVHSPNQGLRIAVQYALGHVAADDRVVDLLLDAMRHDHDPVIQDKAACSLSYDQVLLSEPQKIRLFGELIRSLEDPDLYIRSLAIQALAVYTGQHKGFIPNAPPEHRRLSVARWQQWLAEYRANR